MTHDAARTFLLGKVYKLSEAEEKEVVGGDDEKGLSPTLPHREGAIFPIAPFQTVYGIQQVADGPKAGVIGFGAIIDNGDGLGIVLLGCPLLEDGGKLMIGDDDMLIDIGDSIDIIEHTTKDGVVTNLEQWFGEVLCKIPQASGVASGDYNGFHFSYFSSWRWLMAFVAERIAIAIVIFSSCDGYWP